MPAPKLIRPRRRRCPPGATRLRSSQTPLTEVSPWSPIWTAQDSSARNGSVGADLTLRRHARGVRPAHDRGRARAHRALRGAPLGADRRRSSSTPSRCVAWMIRSYWLYVRPDLPGNLSKSIDALTTVHAVAGLVGVVLGLFVVIRANQLTARGESVARYKGWMRAAYIVYLLGHGAGRLGLRRRSTDDRRRHVTTAAASSTFDRRLLALSVAVQLVLGALFGHAYDTRVFMATGYLVGDRARPLLAHWTSAPSSTTRASAQLTTIGYPPPWPLVHGAALPGDLRRSSPDLHRLRPGAQAAGDRGHRRARVPRGRGAAAGRGAGPRRVAQGLGLPALQPAHPASPAPPGGRSTCIVALLAVAALVLVWRGRWASSAAPARPGRLRQADGRCPSLLVVLVWLAGRAPREALRYAAVFARLGRRLRGGPRSWRSAGDPTQILHRPNAHFLMTGGLSYTTVARLVRDPLPLPGHWWLLGLLWVPALAVAAWSLLARAASGFDDLVRGSAALVARLLPHAHLAGRAQRGPRAAAGADPRLARRARPARS